MHRLGFLPEQAPDAYRQLAELPQVQDRPGLLTHLANADDRDDPATSEQLARFRPLAEQLGVETSIANSAGILGWPDSRGDWVRPGLMLYGASPFITGEGAELGLRPVMTLSARLIAINHLKAGDPVGYGGTWRCPQDMAVGVVGIGYGDGYPREIAPGTPVVLAGRRATIVGRVSMDMLSIDLREFPDARIGDEVTLWGTALPVEVISQAAGTIPYTLTCGITARVRHAVVGVDP
jgi:alanine racemase